MFGIPTRHYRIAVQALVFGVWALCIYATQHPIDASVHWIVKFLPVSFMLRIDPLVMTVVMGGMRLGISILMVGFITLFLTIALGRVFCGWVCPLGAIFDFYGNILKRLRIPIEGPSPSWFRLKYYLLILILVFAILGLYSPLMGLDPIVLLTRVMATVLGPLMRVTQLGYPLPSEFQLHWEIGETPARFGNWVDTATVILFVGILFKTTQLSRIWCRTACPLGAYLAVFSRNSILRRDTSGCVHCNICARHCPTGAIDFKNPEFYTESECIKCFACSQECPVDANFFTFKNPFEAATSTYQPVELSRRNWVGTTVSAVIAAPWIRLGAGEPQSSKKLIRPPMSREEHDFLSSCIRCGECMKACPTGVLKPAGLEHGFRAFWTPVMTTSEAQCMQGCQACSVACPTDAILKYPIEKKYDYKAGTAVFQPSLCISHTENKFCSECLKVCPTDAIAIQKGWIPESGVGSDLPAPEGQIAQRPTHVIFDRCVGCGACEQACHHMVLGPAAMITTSAGRARPTQLKT